MYASFRSTFLCATLLSLTASSAFAQYVAPPAAVVPYDAPSQTLIPRAGSIGRALTPPTYYRSAPQVVPTTVYRPSTAYHPVTGQPYTRWDAASTLDVETQRVATPLPGYGAPFTAYRPAAPVTAMPAYYAPSRPMNVQGWVDPYSGNVANAPIAGYSAFRPIYNPGPGTQSVAPAYAVGRPVMGAPVVSYRGAWPMAVARPAPVAVQYAPTPGYAPPAVYAQPVYRGTTAPSYSGATPAYVAPPYSTPAYAAPVYAAPSAADPYYAPRTGGPVYSQPAYTDPGYSSPGYSDPGYAPSGEPADSRPTLRSSSMAPSTSGAASSGSASATAARPLVPAREDSSKTTSPTVSPEVNWPRFLPNTARQPAPASRIESPLARSEPGAATSSSRGIASAPKAAEVDPEVRPLRDPNSRVPDMRDHRAPPLLEGRSAGVTAPIRRLTLTPSDNVTGHTTNPAR